MTTESPDRSGLLYDARPRSPTVGQWLGPGPESQATQSTSEAGLAYQALNTSSFAAISTPLVEAAALGDSPLDTKQRGAVIGEPVPIVFCRRVGDVGGVLISPAATEARFEDDASSNITASYHLVLSEGQIDPIQVRDVFQRSCRVGSFTQTYNRRAGTFVPGNFIDNTPNLEAPTYCGTGGTYAGLSTMAFTVTIPAGFDQWNRQVHAFIRGGLHVSRLLDGVTGPSNNVADLLLYLLRNSSKVPEAMVDTFGSFLDAARFTNANGFWFNGSINQSTNLVDWASGTLKYFLLRQTRIGGKESLAPLLPVNTDGTINTGPVSWEFTFTSQHVIPGSFEIIFTPLADRKPFCVTALWRQQDDLGIPVMRTAEVRYAGTAIDGPFEQHDLSTFCASEDHAVKAGTYILSRRRHITHRLRLAVKPDAFNPTLASGDLVRVTLQRTPSTGAASVHDYLYEVDRIGKSISGEVQLELTHFPVDASGASVVAQEVAAAVGSGLLLPTGLSGITCDINSFTDTSVPAETFTEATFPDYGVGIFLISEEDPGEDQENPEDILYEAGVYFVSANWGGTSLSGASLSDTTLTIIMRLRPFGKAPKASLGPLFASIASESVVALLPNGDLAHDQPTSLPSVSFSGLIASPWNDETLPIPPANMVFEGRFIIPYPESAFPPVAEDPADQLTYRAKVKFDNFTGGFASVSPLNDLIVDFVSTSTDPIDGVFDWYLIEYYWAGGTDLDTRTSAITAGVVRSQDANKYIGYAMEEELLNAANQPVMEWAGDQTGQGPAVEQALVTSSRLPDVLAVQLRLAAFWYGKGFGFIDARVYGYNGGAFSLDSSSETWVNTTATEVQLLDSKQISIPTTALGDSANNFEGYDVATLTIDLGSGAAEFDVSIVTLAVAPSSVAEDGAGNLIFTFTRTVPTTSALSVNYTVGGTATLGTDYTGIAATPATKTVTFTAGSATALVTVDPTGDSTTESNETVELTIAAGEGYIIGTTAAVVGTITNDD